PRPAPFSGAAPLDLGASADDGARFGPDSWDADPADGFRRATSDPSLLGASSLDASPGSSSHGTTFPADAPAPTAAGGVAAAMGAEQADDLTSFLSAGAALASPSH